MTVFCLVDSSCWFVDFHCWWFQFSSEEPVLTEISTVTGANNLIVLGLRFFSPRSSPVGYLDVLRLRINWSCIVFLLPVFFLYLDFICRSFENFGEWLFILSFSSFTFVINLMTWSASMESWSLNSSGDLCLRWQFQWYME
jgi:hypothetical protein